MEYPSELLAPSRGTQEIVKNVCLMILALAFSGARGKAMKKKKQTEKTQNQIKKIMNFPPHPKKNN